jgi:hypothetical protein
MAAGFDESLRFLSVEAVDITFSGIPYEDRKEWGKVIKEYALETDFKAEKAQNGTISLTYFLAPEQVDILTGSGIFKAAWSLLSGSGAFNPSTNLWQAGPFSYDGLECALVEVKFIVQ